MRRSAIGNRYLRRILAYRPQPYDGKLTFLACEDREVEDAARVWKDVATAGLEVRYLHGDHYTHLREHAATTAGTLEECLRRAREDREQPRNGAEDRMTGEVTVRWGRLGSTHGAARFEPLLSRDERERAASFRFARDRLPLRRRPRTSPDGPRERLGLDPARIEFAYGERGKPCLPDHTGLHFNLSHSAGMMALAISEGREVGIDVEAVREDLFAEGIAPRYLPAEVAEEIELRAGTERSREFYRGWVRQEAYAKARGGGLTLIGESPDPGSWSVIDLDSPDGFAGALAIESGEKLVANAARVGYAGGEVGQVVDVLLVRTPKPIR